LLARCLKTGLRPRQHVLVTPIVWPPTGTGTGDGGMYALEAAARRMEQEIPDVLAVNVVGGYAYADVHDAGLAFSVVTEGDDQAAKAALQELPELAGVRPPVTGPLRTLFELLFDVTEPVLRPIRRIVPPAGPLDLSVIVVFYNMRREAARTFILPPITDQRNYKPEKHYRRAPHRAEFPDKAHCVCRVHQGGSMGTFLSEDNSVG